MDPFKRIFFYIYVYVFILQYQGNNENIMTIKMK